MKKNKIICQICKDNRSIEIKKNNFFLRTDSSDKKLINFKNFICYNCGTIYHHPNIEKKKLINHYRTGYRKTDLIINLDDKSIDLPLKFEWTGISFQRFHAFYKILKKNIKIRLNNEDKILDYGCYQGAFLYACKKIYKVKVIGADYNKDGLRMAKSYFGVDKVFEINDNFFKKKINAKIMTLIHVFEHLMDPVSFLKKIKKNTLAKNGLVYLEIPNPFSNPLNDPTHLFLYSEDSIKYILKSCNYEIICLEKRGLYKDSNLLRNNKNLNLHILAKSLNKKDIYFPKIYIGNKVYSKLIRERNFISVQSILKRIKYSTINSFETFYNLSLFLLNLISSNFAVYVHNKLKEKFKKK